MTNGDLICESLRRAGIDTVFGIPGTQSVSFFECIRKSSLRTVLTTTEFAATMAANGYYRSSGKLCAVTSIQGPGFTPATTGIAEAYHDSAAFVHLLVKAPDEQKMAFGLQEIDHEGISKSISKAYMRLDRSEDVPKKVVEACAAALSGEPGPVIVEIDNSLLEQPANRSVPSESIVHDSSILREQIEQVAASIESASRVALFIGQGASGCAKNVVEIAEKLNAPVIATCSGRGIVPESHPLAVCSDFGSWGIETVNRVLDQSDLVIALGCKFSHNGSAGFRLDLPKDKLVHMDASDDVLNANFPATIAIEADVSSFAEALIPAIAGNELRSKWTDAEIRDFKSQHEMDRERAFKLLPVPRSVGSNNKLHFIDALRKTLPEECVIVTDSGLHQLLVRTRFRVECARGLVVPSDFQSMGYGAPAAIGAKVARPGMPVVLVAGDGGMLMTGMELTTAVRENLQLLVLLVNDNNLGQIRIQQLSRYGRGHATKTSQVDFEQLAKGIGANYMLLSTDYAAEIANALAMPGVTIAEIRMKDTLQTHVRRSKAVAKEFGRAVGADKLRKFIRKLAKFSESN